MWEETWWAWLVKDHCTHHGNLDTNVSKQNIITIIYMYQITTISNVAIPVHSLHSPV